MVTLALGTVALLGGLSLFALALFLYLRRLGFLRRAREAPGVVVSLERRLGGERGTLIYPVVEFTTAEGEVREFENPVGQNPPAYQEGQRVRVLYDPGRPEGAVIRSFWSLWLACVVTVALGALLTCCVSPALFLTGALAPSPTTPASPRTAEEGRAVQLARQFLNQQRLSWGEPKAITPQAEAGSYLLSYPTPPQEQKVLGDRAVTVDVRSGAVKLVPRE